MAVTPVPGPTSEAVARLEAMCDYMPQIALAVNGFADRGIREWAYATMVGILEGDTDKPDSSDGVLLTRDSPEPPNGTVIEDADGNGDVWARRDDWLPIGMGHKTRPEQRWYSVNYGTGPDTWDELWAHRIEEGISTGPMRPLSATPERAGMAPAAIELVRLRRWIAESAPIAWRESIVSGEGTVDSVIRFLTEGDQARAALLLVRHTLVEHGGFSPEQTDGDLAALIRELATDPPVTSPEIEMLASHLRAEAQPGETAVQVALRLLAEIRQAKVDDRGEGAGAQPGSITAAIDDYRNRTGTS